MADEEVKEESKQEKKERKKREKEEKKEAKRQKQEEAGYEEEDESIGSKLLVFLVAIMIIAVWLAIFALLIKMDVGGFGSTVAYPVLKDVPVLNKILPETEEYAEEDEAYKFETTDDAVARIKELEGQIAALQGAQDQNAAYIAELELQAQELATYKANEASFEATKEKFYEEVVFSDNAPDINEYKTYYESIEPDNAARIYKQVVQKTETEEEIKDYVKAYSSMKPKEAAAIFNTMTDNLNLVAKILKNMEAGDRGKILGAMDQDTAALVTKIMDPD
ncbi:MAG: hypothetical protein IIZ61_03290 [Lachnospiraceae bacterium]|nr:hypothetical protein [Lachnospiraceae bacterium]